MISIVIGLNHQMSPIANLKPSATFLKEKVKKTKENDECPREKWHYNKDKEDG